MGTDHTEQRLRGLRASAWLAILFAIATLFLAATRLEARDWQPSALAAVVFVLASLYTVRTVDEQGNTLLQRPGEALIAGAIVAGVDPLVAGPW
jgi:hypothetical protein